MSKTPEGIAVRVSDGSDSVYRARHGKYKATCTRNLDLAVRRCAAKALGLVEPRRLPGEYPSVYARRVDAAAARVKAYGVGSGIWTAYVLEPVVARAPGGLRVCDHAGRGALCPDPRGCLMARPHECSHAPGDCLLRDGRRIPVECVEAPEGEVVPK